MAGNCASHGLDRGVDRSQQLIAVGTDGGRQFEALLFGLR